MILKNGDCKHIFLYGTFNENKYFTGEFKNSFDIVGFNASIISHAPEGIAALISRLSNKAYFIDPQTYAFQQPIRTIQRKDKNNDLVTKKSIQSLAEEFGSIIKKNVGTKSLSTKAFDEKAINEVCINVLNFEKNKIHDSINDEIKEFLDFSDTKKLLPHLLIAPYFYLEPDDCLNILELNMKFISVANKLKKEDPDGLPVYAEIVISQEVLLDETLIDEIIKNYSNCESDGFIIWIDNFCEFDDDTSENLLRKYFDFVSKLGKSRKPIINLHGSFFSIILSGKQSLLAGVGHGIEYGESRSVVPVGGGVPQAKFYFPKFFKRIKYHPDAENVLLKMKWDQSLKGFHKNVCDCKMCKEIIRSNVSLNFSEYGEVKISSKNGKAYPTSAAMDKSRKHYLYSKISEYKKCAELPFLELLNELGKNIRLSKKISNTPFEHLKKWFNVLNND